MSYLKAGQSNCATDCATREAAPGLRGAAQRAAVVIVNYRTPNEVFDLTLGLCDQVEIELRCVVVDNSGDVESAHLQPLTSAGIPYVVLRPGNVGYGVGNNLGMAEANRIWGSRFMVLSNPDVVLSDRRVIADMLRSFESRDHASVLAVGPSIRTRDGVQQNPHFVNDFDAHQLRMLRAQYCWPGLSHVYALARVIRYGLLHAVPVRRRVSDTNEVDSNRGRRDVFALHGSFLAVDYLACRALGIVPVYDSSVFLYGEEIMLARKIARAGGVSVFDPEVEVTHLEDASTADMSNLASVLWSERHHRRAWRRILREYY